MKMNKTKIIVPALALAMGAALAGSVSGTVAWFQYSTRAQAAYIGTTAHCSEALEIQATKVGVAPTDNGWKTELKATDIAAASADTGSELSPITSGVLAKDAALTPANFKSNPIYQYFEYEKWQAATADNYVQFDLHFRVRDVDGENPANLLAKKLYLSDLSIVSLKDKTPSGYEEDGDSDLFKAVRVHIACGSTYKLFANDGTTATEVTTSVGQKLDLNQDGSLDTTPAYSDWEAGTETIYGASGNQVANNVGAANLFANDDDPSAIVPNSGLLGTTTKSSTMLKATVTMWIEGWAGLGHQDAVLYTAEDAEVIAGEKNVGDVKVPEINDSPIWDPETYVGAKFGVGFRFSVPAHGESTDHPVEP